MNNRSRRMVISPLWLQTAVLVFLAGFAVLGYLAYRIYADRPPVPRQVLADDGSVLFTADDIMAGQQVFQKYGLMQYGTIFGHGAYLGPDFTAEYLHRAGLAMLDFYSQGGKPTPAMRDRVTAELKQNRYNPETGDLTYTAGQTAAFEELAKHYGEFFGDFAKQGGLKRPYIGDPKEVRRLAAYFSWAAWVSSAKRPDAEYSYTNNWPPDPAAGNTLTAQAVLWSALSLVALLGGTGLVFFAVGRYDLLGWHRADEEQPGRNVRFRPPEDVRLAPAQRATAWYFLVIAGLFLAQGLLGGVNAHYHAEPGGFYGIDVARWLPYNLSRMWHVQLALFFVAASYLAMGIFIAPMIARREPKHQEKLAIALFGALVFVVVGSLLGEAASIRDDITRSGPWFWIGAQGWEYVDLGRLWQILLVVGMVLWVVILVRGMSVPAARRAPGQHAVPVPLQRDLDPALLRRRHGVLEKYRVRRDGLLAILGGSPLGRGFPGAVHHDHGGLRLRALGRGPPSHRHPRDLPRHHPLLARRRDRHDAPPLLQRCPGRAHGLGRVLLGDGGDSAGALDLRGVAIHAAGDLPHRAFRAQHVQRSLSAQVGRDVPDRRGVLELPRGGSLRVPDQPAGRQLLRNRHAVHRQPRPRRVDGRLRHAGHRLLHVRGPLLHPARQEQRACHEAFFLVSEHRAGNDALRQPDPDGDRAALRQRAATATGTPGSRSSSNFPQFG